MSKKKTLEAETDGWAVYQHIETHKIWVWSASGTAAEVPVTLIWYTAEFRSAGLALCDENNKPIEYPNADKAAIAIIKFLHGGG